MLVSDDAGWQSRVALLPFTTFPFGPNLLPPTFLVSTSGPLPSCLPTGFQLLNPPATHSNMSLCPCPVADLPTGFQLRSMLTHAVYQKVLSMAPTARAKFTSGEWLDSPLRAFNVFRMALPLNHACCTLVGAWD